MIRKAAVILMFVSALGTFSVGVVSYWKGVPDNAIWITRFPKPPRFQAAMIRGILHVVHTAPRPPGGTTATELRWGPFYFKRADMGFVEATGGGVPFWSLSGTLMICPLVAMVRGPLRRRRRRKRRECIHCGYSLIGLTEPRCPECGNAFERFLLQYARP